MRLADALAAAGDESRAAKIRPCATTFDWDPARASDWEAFVCPNGDSAPLRPLRPHSCDDPAYPACMPFRLAADWKRKWASDQAPGVLTIVRLRARTPSVGLEDATYLQRVCAQFRAYRHTHHLRGGFYGVSVVRDGDQWRAVISLAVGGAEAAAITDSKQFTCTVIATQATADDLLQVWQQQYLQEATAWANEQELLELRRLTHGRRQFQGFGDQFAAPLNPSARTGEDARALNALPLHRVSGGSGARDRTPPRCPRCGAPLRGMGRFDPERMEVLAAADGWLEWRWRREAAA